MGLALQSNRDHKVGLLGGTFNPVHMGHLHMAAGALKVVDEVWFLPLNIPPHKPTYEVVEGRHRAAMIEAAIQDEMHFKVCTVELDRGGITYTVDTLRELKGRYPAYTFYYIVGADTVFQMTTWKNAHEAMRLTRFLVVCRPGEAREKLTVRMEELRKEGVGLTLLDLPEIDVSSTKVREALKRGESLAGLLPESVADYIDRWGLYR